MAEDKTPEAILQEALLAEQAKTKQLGIDLGQERELRGKAEQELRDANKIIDDLNVQVGEKATGKPEAPTATLGTGKDAKTYRFLVPQFHLAGHGVVVAKEVKNNSDVLAALVKAGAKVIELVPAK